MTGRSLDPRRLIDEFAELFPEDRVPIVRGVAIVSLDGALTRDGRSGKLGGPADARLMSFLRRSADTVLVGARTAEIEQYAYPLLEPEDQAWRVARGLPPEPHVGLISRSAHPAAEARLNDSRNTVVGDIPPVTVFHSVSSGAGFAADAITNLQGSGFHRIIVEGGPTVWRDALHANLMDEFSITISPVLVGSREEMPLRVEPSTEFTLFDSLQVDSFVIGRYAIK